MTELTQERLKELLDYDPETGVFRWRVSRRGPVSAGDVAGYARSDGYRKIKIDGKNYLAHRLAWLYVYGRWPVFQIDHINGVPGNDWIDNLREAESYSEQSQNLKLYSNNTSGYPGVSWDKARGKWEAYIRTNGKRRHLGLFDDLQAAARAYRVAKRQYHAFCPGIRVCNVA